MDVRALTVRFLEWFNSLWAREAPVTAEEAQSYVAQTIRFSLNGRLIADGVEAYAARIDGLRRQCRSLRIEFPVAEMVVEGSHVAVRFFETLVYDDGSVHDMVDGAFIQFDDHGKIAAFHDVFSGGDPVRTIR